MGKKIEKEGLEEIMEEKTTKKKAAKKSEKQIAMEGFVENAKEKKSFTYKEIVILLDTNSKASELAIEIIKELEER